MTSEGIILCTVAGIVALTIGADVLATYQEKREFRKEQERRDAWINLKRDVFTRHDVVRQFPKGRDEFVLALVGDLVS